MEQIVFLNGLLLPKIQATISPFDFGFLYGYALFETMRAYSGKIFRLQRHLDRITHSASILAIPISDFDMGKACYDTLRANRLEDARIRLTISLGDGEGTPNIPSHPKPIIFITANQLKPIDDNIYLNGYKAIVSSTRHNSRSLISHMKTVNYLNNLLARQEARESGADEAILLNDQGHVCEGSSTNIFFVSDNTLFTPNIESGCLPGITRQCIIELASNLKMPTTQREINLEELLHADEVFLTSSLIEIMPLSEIDHQKITKKNGRIGKVTMKLIGEYRALIEKELNC